MRTERKTVHSERGRREKFPLCFLISWKKKDVAVIVIITEERIGEKKQIYRKWVIIHYHTYHTFEWHVIHQEQRGKEEFKRYHTY